MNIEKMLAEEFHAVADALDVPPAPTADLVREGDRARNRTRVYAAGLVAAAVAIVVAGLALADRDSRDGEPGLSTTSPSPTVTVDGLPVGEPPMLPWIDANRDLHVSDTVIDGPFLDISGQGPWIAGLTGDRDAKWYNIVDGVPQLAAADLAAPGAVSPDGRWWATIRIEEDGRHSLVRYDAENPDDRPVHDLGQPSGEADGAIGVGGVDNRGRVYSANLSGGIMWVPETDSIVELRDGDHYWEIVGVGPEGPMVSDGPGQDPFLTVMADDGTIESQLALPNVLDDTVNPAGTRTAWLTDHRGRDLQRNTEFSGVLDAVTVQELATGQRATIPLPTGSDLRQIRWEDEDTVLLAVAIDRVSGTNRFARCDVVAATCEWAGQS